MAEFAKMAAAADPPPDPEAAKLTEATVGMWRAQIGAWADGIYKKE